MVESKNLVNVTDFGIKGINYYWTKKEQFQIREEELRNIGVTNGNAYVDQALIAPLKEANNILKKNNFELIVKDAYRSPELYQLIQKKRYALLGKEDTDRLLNMEAMPHATGRTIDVNLIDLKTGEEVTMRDPKDKTDAFFIDFYKSKTDEQGQLFQTRQTLLISTMLSVGFRLGVKKEFWHFEY